MEEKSDIYRTILSPAEALFKDRGSRFLSYAYPVDRVEQVKNLVDKLRKQYYDATHHCYAYRIGSKGAEFRANDDGEPSGTAGRPILGQMLSNDVTDCLIVVVRYFGGTKLGVPGLINAYKTSAGEVLQSAQIVERYVKVRLLVEYSYVVINDVMRIVKEEKVDVVDQAFDNLCTIVIEVRKSAQERVEERLSKIEGVGVNILTE